MTEDEIKELSKKIDAWCSSPEGQQRIQATADMVAFMQEQAAQKRRDDIASIAVLSRNPMTI